MKNHEKSRQPLVTREIISDGSPIGLGAVLFQEQNGEKRVVVSYARRSLTSVERRHGQNEGKLLV